jgi:Icc-related predicted phosphoesterase
LSVRPGNFLAPAAYCIDLTSGGHELRSRARADWLITKAKGDDVKIHYVSDIHVEFGALDKPLPEGDILLLAGDTTVIALLAKHRQDAIARSVKKATKRLNDEIARKFQRAYAVIGNHEPYGSHIGEASEALAAALPSVTVLDCEHVNLSDDVILFGAALWTDMDRGDPLSSLAIRNGMTDFRLIKAGVDEPFTPEMAAAEFHNAIAYLGRLAEENRSKTVVVMTHHAPSRQGLSSRVPNALDRAYYSDLEYFIESHPNIRYWIFGHTHIRRTFEIAHCKVMSNARGYYRHEPMAQTFNPDVSFEVEHRQVPVAEGIEARAQLCRQIGAKTNDETSGRTDT